jgi:hypothetical protein
VGWVREQEAKQRAAEERLQVAQRRREEEEARVRAREREKGRKMQEAKAVAQRSKLMQEETEHEIKRRSADARCGALCWLSCIHVRVRSIAQAALCVPDLAAGHLQLTGGCGVECAVVAQGGGGAAQAG